MPQARWQTILQDDEGGDYGPLQGSRGNRILESGLTGSDLEQWPSGNFGGCLPKFGRPAPQNKFACLRNCEELAPQHKLLGNLTNFVEIILATYNTKRLKIWVFEIIQKF